MNPADASERFVVLDERPNAALASMLRILRSIDLQKDRDRFRRTMARLGMVMAYEIGARLETCRGQVQTPLGGRTMDLPSSTPVLATAMRAGVPFLEGFLEMFPESDVSFFGAARVEHPTEASGLAMPVELDYESLSDMEDKVVIFVDPMVATGSTIIDIHARLVALDRHPQRFIVAGAVGYRGAYERLCATIPDVELFLATADDALDERNYIVPGLGDAGDLCYGPKAES